MTEKPNLSRIWAQAAGSGNVVDPGDTKFSTGWTTEKPPFQTFNYLQQVFTQGLAHMDEEGISVYGVNTNYPINALAKGSDGLIYVALAANGPASTVVNPVGDLTSTWIKWLDSTEFTSRFRSATDDTFSEEVIVSGLKPRYSLVETDLANRNAQLNMVNGTLMFDEVDDSRAFVRNLATFGTGASAGVSLFHGGFSKLQTTSTGVNINGTLSGTDLVATNALRALNTTTSTQANLVSGGGAIALQVEDVSGTPFTKTVLTCAAAIGQLSMRHNDVEVLRTQTGLVQITGANGLQVVNGNLTVSAGNVIAQTGFTATTGDIEIQNGSLEITSGTIEMNGPSGNINFPSGGGINVSGGGFVNLGPGSQLNVGTGGIRMNNGGQITIPTEPTSADHAPRRGWVDLNFASSSIDKTGSLIIAKVTNGPVAPGGTTNHTNLEYVKWGSNGNIISAGSPPGSTYRNLGPLLNNSEISLWVRI